MAPTLKTLEAIARFDSVGALLAWARRAAQRSRWIQP